MPALRYRPASTPALLLRRGASAAATLLLLVLLGGCADDTPSGETASSGAATGAAAGTSAACDPDNGGLTLPQGFCATVFADGVGRARHIAVDAEGDVYVRLREEREGGSIVALRDTTGDGRADVRSHFGSETGAGTGIAVSEGHLYVSSDLEVFRFPLQAGELAPSAGPELIVTGFPEQSTHEAKSIALNGSGGLYVNVGAPSNTCQVQDRTLDSPGQDPCPELERQAGIWRFDANRAGQTQAEDGTRFATGIRNAVALTAHDGQVYAAQHGRDQLYHLYPELYNEQQSAELPAEELLRVTEGADFGWPYCFYDQYQGKKVLAPEYGGDGKEVGRCADAPAPLVAFPGHYAPNGLLFYTGDHFPDRYQGGAFVAFHGSWNRAPEPQQGYLVAFVPFQGGEPAGDWEVFADGFKGQETLESPNNAAHRPMGLAQAPDGALYIADSVEGRIWKVVYGGDE